jgi:hypothetical protein
MMIPSLVVGITEEVTTEGTTSMVIPSAMVGSTGEVFTEVAADSMAVAAVTAAAVTGVVAAVRFGAPVGIEPVLARTALSVERIAGSL